jgi:phosphonoacetate hydrolase
MFDGFGDEYYRNSTMPALNYIANHGLYKVVPSLMPSATNVNNASICTGVLPSVHGITGNSFFNLDKGEEEFMEDDTMLLAPTLFERAEKQGIKSALFSSKKKTINLLSRGSSIAVSPETASQEWVSKVGVPPSIYSREVNYWLMEAALYTMKHDSSIGIFYIHSTDYPMHTWSPDAAESKEHLKRMDDYIAQIIKAAPDAMVLITADHTVKHKSICIDLEKACFNRGLSIRSAVSIERDRYVKQHKGFGGVSYVYLNNPNDLSKAKKIIEKIKGVDKVYTREEAAQKFFLMPHRIGDLVVLGNEKTAFGNLDREVETMPETYRTHGSLYEARVPLFIYNARNAPPASYFDKNYKIAAWLFK